MRETSEWRLGRSALLATLAAILLAVFCRVDPGLPDAVWYALMAMGRTNEVLRPFCVRALSPLAASGLMHLGLSMERSFAVLGLAGVWFMTFCVGWLAKGSRRYWLTAMAGVLALPFFAKIYEASYLPDAVFGGLLAIYLLLLSRRRWAWAGVMLLVMFLARETTLLVGAIAIVLVWRSAGRRPALLQAGGWAIGMATSKMLARRGLPNHHGLNDTLYMLGKVPWNLSRNVFGRQMWDNTTVQIPRPAVVHALPHFLQMGALREFGFRDFSPVLCEETAKYVLGGFGIGLVLLILVLKRLPRKVWWPREAVHLQICLVYGAATFLLSPLLGASVDRLVAYAWPLFFIYLVAMLGRAWSPERPQWQAWALLAVHIAVGWLPMASLSDGMRFTAILAGYGVAAWIVFGMEPKHDPVANPNYI